MMLLLGHSIHSLCLGALAHFRMSSSALLGAGRPGTFRIRLAVSFHVYFYLYFPSLSCYISMCQNTALTIACIPTPPSPAAPKLVMDMTRPNIMPMPPSSILSRVKAFLPEMQLANTTLQQEMYTLLFFLSIQKVGKSRGH